MSNNVLMFGNRSQNQDVIHEFKRNNYQIVYCHTINKSRGYSNTPIYLGYGWDNYGTIMLNEIKSLIFMNGCFVVGDFNNIPLNVWHELMELKHLYKNKVKYKIVEKISRFELIDFED